MVRNKEIESIFRTLYRPLCLYALHYLEDTEAVEDVVQDSFIALWNSGERVENAKAWMYRAVRNRCIDHLRRSRSAWDDGTLLPRDLEGEISDVEAAERSAVEARLWEAVEALPEMRRKCLLMAKRDGLSYKEIAQELGIAEHTVRNHISRALETLREGRRHILQFIFSFF
ncbi:MAG: RNA polymerase sigma-70 factor [Bacteroidales bacterium]|nr:RNA polymerase sigma-70 factor [Bacteroidales bacterium]